jgi:FixJ family two-component response regulator
MKMRCADPLAELTEGEREVLGRMAEGRSNQAIAQQLVVTERAVEEGERNRGQHDVSGVLQRAASSLIER